MRFFPRELTEESFEGFGDYVPGNRYDTGKFYKVFVIIWMIVGLSSIVMVSVYSQKLVEFLIVHISHNHKNV